jgi:hypothetical protein
MKSMKRLVAPALIFVALAAPAGAETRNLSGFRSVSAADRLTVEVSIGEAYAVEVTGSDASRIRTTIENDTLRIRDDDRPWFGASPRLDAHVRVTVPALEAVSAARGAELTAALAGSPCNDFEASAAMGGTTHITGAQCDDVSASAAMGGEVRLEGACRELSASAAMGGVVRADDLQCVTVDASASMGGDIRAFASQRYEASAAMGGAINVAGGGNAEDTSSVMGGSIRSTNRR